MDIFEIIKGADGIVSVLVLVFFGIRLSDQINVMQQNQQEIIKQLIDLCADREGD